jgi:hypothetical protein
VQASTQVGPIDGRARLELAFAYKPRLLQPGDLPGEVVRPPKRVLGGVDLWEQALGPQQRALGHTPGPLQPGRAAFCFLETGLGGAACLVGLVPLARAPRELLPSLPFSPYQPIELGRAAGDLFPGRSGGLSAADRIDLLAEGLRLRPLGFGLSMGPLGDLTGPLQLPVAGKPADRLLDGLRPGLTEGDPASEVGQLRLEPGAGSFLEDEDLGSGPHDLGMDRQDGGVVPMARLAQTGVETSPGDALEQARALRGRR